MMIDEAGLTARVAGHRMDIGCACRRGMGTSAKLMAAPHPITRELGLWLGVAVMSTVFSAACAVLCGVKEAAERAAARVRTRQG